MDDMPQLKRKHPLSALPDCHGGEIQLRDAIQSKLIYALGKSSESATSNDWYQATALAVRDRVVDIWRETRAETKRLKKKTGLLPVDRISDRPLAARYIDQSSAGGAGAGSAGEHGRGSRRSAPRRTRCCARQRRTRTTGCVLHGQYVGPRHSGLWLRHTVREWTV